jgi:hypothetical protein
MKYVALSILFIVVIVSRAKGNLSESSGKIAEVITKAAKDDSNNELENSLYFKPAVRNGLGSPKGHDTKTKSTFSDGTTQPGVYQSIQCD